MKTPEQLTHKATHHRRHRGREVFRAFATASGSGSGSSPLRAIGNEETRRAPSSRLRAVYRGEMHPGADGYSRPAGGELPTDRPSRHARYWAQDRTAPVLPLRLGIPEKHMHEYVRQGTTTLFAAVGGCH